MAWAGWGSTPQTKPTYLADRYVAHGYEGLKEDLLKPATVPVGQPDATRTPPCDEVLGWRYTHPGQPAVLVGATGAGVVSHAMPGGGLVEVFYPCP